jgi:hypothetical protein
MKTLPNSQATFFDGMELPLMSSQADSRAKTLAALESKLASKKEPAQDCGPKLSDLLASYHRDTSSWRTSQRCLVALATNEGDGLAEYSETWPSAGMMRNGVSYRQQPWALPIAESASGLWRTPTVGMVNQARAKDPEYGVRLLEKGQTMTLAAQVLNKKLWPTPTARDYKGWRKPETLAAAGRGATNSLNDALTCQGQHGALNPTWVEWLMGFPQGWTDLKD